MMWNDGRQHWWVNPVMKLNIFFLLRWNSILFPSFEYLWSIFDYIGYSSTSSLNIFFFLLFFQPKHPRVFFSRDLFFLFYPLSYTTTGGWKGNKIHVCRKKYIHNMARKKTSYMNENRRGKFFRIKMSWKMTTGIETYGIWGVKMRGKRQKVHIKRRRFRQMNAKYSQFARFDALAYKEMAKMLCHMIKTSMGLEFDDFMIVFGTRCWINLVNPI